LVFLEQHRQLSVLLDPVVAQVKNLKGLVVSERLPQYLGVGFQELELHETELLELCEVFGVFANSNHRVLRDWTVFDMKNLEGQIFALEVAH